MNRNNLIYYAKKYEGDYNRITVAIRNEEEVNEECKDRCITILDDEYPKSLLDLNYPPFVLFYEGDISLLKSESIAVVGSRNPTEYSKQATKDLVQNTGKTVVSGLAKGIDAIAHENASRSIGVLGSGINYAYPYENKDLIDRMKKEQLVISEYPDRVKPYAYHFPFRNRIIAALSNTVYIMETKEFSGTMTTVNEALELGKEVKVLPFDIYSSGGKGNLKLIHEGADIIDTKEIFG